MSHPDHTEPNTKSATELLVVAADELAALRSQAEQAASRIATRAPEPGSLGPEDALLADLAGSLVSRSHSMAVECRRLSELMDRVAGLYAPPGSDPVPPAPAGGSAPAAAPQASQVQPPAAAAGPQASTPQAPSGQQSAAPAPAESAQPPAPTEAAGAQPDAPPGAAEAERAASGATDAVEVSEGVKLLVTQMAVSGAGRQEIERRLVSDFGITRPAEVLEQLFGSR